MANNISRLCAELSFIVLSAVGLLLSTHLFTDHVFSRDFYIYYTNITNFLCLCITIYCFSINLKSIKRHKPLKYSKRLEFIKVVASILICITFLIFNILLADFSLNNYFLNLYNLLYHVVLPIWFIIYTFTTTVGIFWFAPLIAVLVQAIYVAIVFVRAVIIKGQAGRIIFPYFFLNYQTLGFSGTIKWLAIMFIVTLIVGYFIVIIKWLINKKYKKQKEPI